MEEILASIRRIISDDDTGKAAKPAEPPALAKVPPVTRAQPTTSAASNSQDDIDAMLADLNSRSQSLPSMAAPTAEPAPPAPTASEVLELGEGMAAPPAPPAHFRGLDPDSDLVFADQPAPAPPEPPAHSLDEERRPFTPAPERALVSNTTEVKVDHAFNALANTVLGTHMRTLEDLVQEMLRPMLKGWLDDNLPSLVERIVRDEIERVSRGSLTARQAPPHPQR